MMGCVRVQSGIGIKGNGTRKTDQHHHQSGLSLMEIGFLFLLLRLGSFRVWVLSSLVVRVLILWVCMYLFLLSFVWVTMGFVIGESPISCPGLGIGLRCLGRSIADSDGTVCTHIFNILYFLLRFGLGSRGASGNGQWKHIKP